MAEPSEGRRTSEDPELLELVLRVSLGGYGQTSLRHRQLTLGEAAALFWRLEPFRETLKEIGAADDATAKERIADAILAWILQSNRPLLPLSDSEIQVLRPLAEGIANSAEFKLARDSDQIGRSSRRNRVTFEVHDAGGGWTKSITSDQANRTRNEACRKLARSLLAQGARDPVEGRGSFVADPPADEASARFLRALIEESHRGEGWWWRTDAVDRTSIEVGRLVVETRADVVAPQPLAVEEVASLLANEDRVIVVTGPGGDGKSWLLQQIARRLATTALEGGPDSDSPFPLLVHYTDLLDRLGDTTDDSDLLGPLVQAALDVVPAAGTNAGRIVNFIRENNRRVVVLLDGIDETTALRSERKSIRQIMSRSGTSLLAAGRPFNDLSEHLGSRVRRFSLKPMDEEDFERLIRAWVMGDAADAAISYLMAPQFEYVRKSPALLTFAALLLDQSATSGRSRRAVTTMDDAQAEPENLMSLPERPVDLLLEMVDFLLRHPWRSPQTSDAVASRKRIAGLLALKLAEQESDAPWVEGDLLRVVIGICEQYHLWTTEFVQNDLTRARRELLGLEPLIIPAAGPKPSRAFAHGLLREVLVAWAIIHDPDSGWDRSARRAATLLGETDRVMLPTWLTTCQFVTGLVESDLLLAFVRARPHDFGLERSTLIADLLAEAPGALSLGHGELQLILDVLRANITPTWLEHGTLKGWIYHSQGRGHPYQDAALRYLERAPEAVGEWARAQFKLPQPRFPVRATVDSSETRAGVREVLDDIYDPVGAFLELTPSTQHRLLAEVEVGEVGGVHSLSWAVVVAELAARGNGIASKKISELASSHPMRNLLQAIAQRDSYAYGPSLCEAIHGAHFDDLQRLIRLRSVWWPGVYDDALRDGILAIARLEDADDHWKSCALRLLLSRLPPTDSSTLELLSDDSVPVTLDMWSQVFGYSLDGQRSNSIPPKILQAALGAAVESSFTLFRVATELPPGRPERVRLLRQCVRTATGEHHRRDRRTLLGAELPMMTTIYQRTNLGDDRFTPLDYLAEDVRDDSQDARDFLRSQLGGSFGPDAAAALGTGDPDALSHLLEWVSSSELVYQRAAAILLPEGPESRDLKFALSNDPLVASTLLLSNDTEAALIGEHSLAHCLSDLAESRPDPAQSEILADSERRLIAALWRLGTHKTLSAPLVDASVKLIAAGHGQDDFAHDLISCCWAHHPDLLLQALITLTPHKVDAPHDVIVQLVNNGRGVTLPPPMRSEADDDRMRSWHSWVETAAWDTEENP